MDVRTDLFYKRARMTPQRQHVADVMNIDEEGLAPRAFSVLLQIWDGQQLSKIDAEWVAQNVEWGCDTYTFSDGKPGLTELGQQIAKAADVGDADTIYRSTTRPDW